MLQPVSRTLSEQKGRELLSKLEAAGVNEELAQKIIDVAGTSNFVERLKGLIEAYNPYPEGVTHGHP